MPFNRIVIAVYLFLAFQAAASGWLGSMESPPAQIDLTKFPQQLAGWLKIVEEPLDPATVSQLGADRTLNWIYQRPGTGQFSNLFVAWFQSQRGGTTQPHSPQVCLPGNGWVSNSAEIVPFRTDAGTIEVTRYIVTRGTERSVILYWYQTPRRVIAREWSAKLWLIPDSIRDHRTDTSLVRIQVWNGTRSDAETTEIAMEVARAAYPALRRLLPHID